MAPLPSSPARSNDPPGREADPHSERPSRSPKIDVTATRGKTLDTVAGALTQVETE